MTLSEKVAYLKGVAEGLKFDPEKSAEGKLISIMMDILEQMCIRDSFVTTRLAPELLGPIAVAAYSYMALVPVIQPPIMRLLTTKKERQIVMKPLRQVSRKEKILFPIVITVFVSLLVPSAAPLVACLMLGVLFKETGVVDRLSKDVYKRQHKYIYESFFPFYYCK